GRTELASSAEEGARALFRSVQKLKTLPDYLEVLPGAFSGSVCGRSLSGKPSSTLGFERRFNRVFQIDDEAAFVRYMMENIPSPPGFAQPTLALNQAKRRGRERRHNSTGAAREPGPVLAPGADQHLCWDDGRAGADRCASDWRKGVRAGLQDRNRFLHRQLRRD